MSQAMDGVSQLEESSRSMALPTSETALQKRKIAVVSKGRALRRVVALFDSIEDLIAENDRRCDGDESDKDVTIE
jgi:hypothetical protein